jgi:cell division protein FtsQ
MWDNHQLLKGLANFLLGASLLMLLYAGGFWSRMRRCFR